MAYRCDSCNLDFSDFLQYLNHECSFYDQQLVMQVCNDIWMCSDAFNSLKTLKERHVSLVNGEYQCISTGSPLEDISLFLDFLQCNENQSCKETPTLLQSFNTTEYCSKVQRSTRERIPDLNLNQPSTLFLARKISENNAQSSSNPLSVLRGVSSFQSSIWEMNSYHDKNELFVSDEYNQIEYSSIKTNPKGEANDPVVKIAHEDKQKYMISSASSIKINNMDLKLEKYSKKYPRNFNQFSELSIVVYAEQKHMKTSVLRRGMQLPLS
ncbi:zinc finger protein [Trichonephila clavata]|uniref:Zinc finger protein n=1 Tax=Trichonephila clavata TaxID=2740835 RepID=A0A8X6HIA5_TRICU|nr:zinc finger protein [Trichonephila clavata]